MIDKDALYVWASLEQARNGVHPYGGDMVEVFAQHLAPGEFDGDQWLEAGKTLYAVLRQFCMVNGVCASVDGKEVGDWMNDYRFFHKCDVRIYINEQDTERTGSSPKVSESGSQHSQKHSQKVSSYQVPKEILSPVFHDGRSEQTFKELENEVQARYQKVKSG